MVKHYTLNVTPAMIRASYESQQYFPTEHAGFVVHETNRPGDNTNLPSSQTSDFYVPYVVPDFGAFIQCFEYYRTIGKVQNVVDSIVANIINREWYFESDKPTRIKAMEDWEEKFDLSRIIEQVVRDWCIFGNSILGFSDWQPMQMTTILGIKRDIYGLPEYFVQTINGKVVDIDAKPFLFSKFIEINRDAWGKPLFGSLMASNYTDIDGKQPLPLLQIYRQMLLDSGRIIHRYGSPVVVWSWPGASRAVLEQDIKPVMEARRPGDRMIFNEKPEFTVEMIDSKARFENYLDLVTQEIDAGLQASYNRLITDPSAMADAKEAGSQDDDRILGIMEKLRRLINKYVIPRVTGEANVCFFKWGSKDTIELEFPDGLKAATQPPIGGKPIISVSEARMILAIKGWKLDDGLYQQDMNQMVLPVGALGDPNSQQPQIGPDGKPLPPQPGQAVKPGDTQLQGSPPTPQPYNPNGNDLDTSITGQGNEPPYRDHTYLPAGTYPNKPPPNSTRRGITAGFGSSLASGETELVRRVMEKFDHDEKFKFTFAKKRT